MNKKKVARVIKMSASWCRPCKAFTPTFKKASELPEFKDIEFKSIDIEEDESGIVEKLGIRTVPTTVLFDEDDAPIYKVIGNIPFNDFVKIINTALGKEDKNEEFEEEV